MLYSKNGGPPRRLPLRIRLSDGSTRTDPATFTPEEILDAGYVAVADPPQIDNMQNRQWVNGSWVISDKSFDEAKNIMLDTLKDIRRRAEQALIFNGMSINLDEKTQGRINDALIGFDFVPVGTTTPWEVSRGIYIDMDQTTLTALGLSGWNHIRDCYINAKNLNDQIQAATTVAELRLIDLTIGWP